MPASKTLNLAILISGSGTTLQNIIDRINDNDLNARIRLSYATLLMPMA